MKKKSMEKNMNKPKKQEKGLVFPQSVLRPVKDFLTKELKRALFRQAQLKEADPFADPGRVNDNASEDTDAAEQFGHARIEAFNKHIEKKVIQIRKALTRIKIGRYGICEKCGQMIDTERLTVFPETTFCVKCGRLTEKKK